MSAGLIVLIVLFVAFILILLFNPNLSCFGRRLRSPFYPLRRSRLKSVKGRTDIKTEDYGFRLVEEEKREAAPSVEAPFEVPSERLRSEVKKPKKTEDYGFKLD